MAAVSVASVVVFGEAQQGRRRKPVPAAAVALATLYVVDLGREGVVFGLSDPDAVLRSRLFASPLSVGLMGLASATVGGATGLAAPAEAQQRPSSAAGAACWTRLLSTTGDDMLDR